MNDEDNQILFSVTLGTLQNEAVDRIGRKLTDDELDTAQKGIEEGLSFDIETVFQAAIEEAVKINSHGEN